MKLLANIAAFFIPGKTARMKTRFYVDYLTKPGIRNKWTILRMALDRRFIISAEWLDFYYGGNFVQWIESYQVIEIPVGKLHAWPEMTEIGNGYCCKYLDSHDDSYLKEFISHSKKNGVNYKWFIVPHIAEKLNNLLKEMSTEGYNPRKGIIVIDKNNVIVDGLHRASCIYKLCGANKKIPVLQIDT